MFQVTKQFRFEASHQLPNHDGKCRRLHGHSWVGKVILESPELIQTGPKAGMVQDFGDISKALKPLLEDFLDHHHLNETLGLVNPTSEEVARWAYNRLKPELPLLIAVQIDETCTSSAVYYGDKELISIIGTVLIEEIGKKQTEESATDPALQSLIVKE